jgi:L-2,4-diaminobutyrate decarboxylase
MNPKALESMIEEDSSSGLIPMMVCATVGTTDFGSIDPLVPLRNICDHWGLWMHTDAAYGGGLLVSGKYRSRIEGVAKTDSLTVDFHKMYLQPISCGGFFLRDGGRFEGLTLHVDYLNRREDEEEGYHNLVGKSLATTRRFDALKLWVSFKSLGRRGWEEMMDRTLDNAQAVYRILERDRRFETVTPPEISSVVFRYTGGSGEDLDGVNAAVRRKLIHQEGILLGQTRVDGRVFLKMTLLNPRVDPLKIAGLMEAVAGMAEEEAQATL